MPRNDPPLFAREAKAAAVLDLKTPQFRKMVDDGVLPRPVERGGVHRWDVQQLVDIWRGKAVGGPQEIEW